MRAAPRTASGAVIAVLALLALLLAVPGPAAAATYQVTMKGYAFSPATLTVPAGSTVTWTNQDTAPHDVKTTSGPVAIHGSMLDKGQSWSYTFGTAGTYTYLCTVHPDMTATIVVKAAAPATTAAPAPTHAAGSGGTHTAASTPAAGSGMAGMTGMPAKTTKPAAAGKASAAPTASPTPTAAPAPQSAQPQAQAAAQPGTETQADTSTLRPLDPLLLLAGLVAGVAVLCLLVVASRAAQAGREDALKE
ncbi:hypothetical protein OK074_6973 [Actinobacteria bacterium OK074]|nr:hypothetical protein OK074_6973 [Actinobacteria bacterium OK074]